MFEIASDNSCKKSNFYPGTLPDEILNDKLRGAEVRFYNALKRQVPTDWLVLYSCAWTSQWSNRTINGEIDFIVVVPAIGILVIELKGGTVWYNGESQQWYQSIPSGPKEINPFRQVKRGVHALRRKLSALDNMAGKRLEIFHAVAVPDVKINFETVGLEIDRKVMIDRTDMNSLTERIEGILRHHVGNEVWKDGIEVRTAIEEELTQSVVLRAPLSLDMVLAEHYMDQLTEEQNSVLEALSDNNRVLIEGCAGSGKTLLALAKAIELARSGKKTLLTCYNRALAERLKTIANGISNLHIYTFHALCEREVRAADKTLRMESEKVWTLHYPMWLRTVMHEHPKRRFDAIVVDEGQDFTEIFWKALLEKCLKDEENGLFYIFYDDEQRLNNSSYAVPSFPVRYRLTRNIRNTKQIFKAWSKFCDTENQYVPGGPSGRNIEVLTYSTESSLFKTLDDVLRRLKVEEEIDLSDITVLAPLGVQDLIGKRLESGIELTNKPGSHNGVHCTTIARFKGLETPVAIMLSLDGRLERLSPEEKRARVYIGMSRAKHHLILLGTLAGIAQIKNLLKR